MNKPMATLGCLGVMGLVFGVLLGACASDPATEKHEKVQQADTIGAAADVVQAYERFAKGACEATDETGIGLESYFIGRVAPDAPDWYSIKLKAFQKLTIDVTGLYGFDPWVALMCRPSSGAEGWSSWDADDIGDRGFSHPKGCSDPYKINSPKMTGTRLDARLENIDRGVDNDCVILISSSDAWPDFHFNENNICRFGNFSTPTNDLPTMLSSLAGAPDTTRSAYVATVLINNAPYANAKRGCTEEKRSFKVGSPPVPLVPFATSPKAADPIACRDECIGPPLPTKCSCPVGEEYCTADKRCYRQQPLVCPSSLDVIAGGCDCCGAVDSEFGFCFPGACHPKITWFEYKCPCQRKGTSCTTNDACCGEKCDVPGGQSQGTCRCLNPGEKCHVSRDCCSYTANESVQSCGKALVNGGYYGNCK